MGRYRCRSRIEGLYIPYRSLIEALYTLNSPPVVSFNCDGMTTGLRMWVPRGKKPFCHRLVFVI